MKRSILPVSKRIDDSSKAASDGAGATVGELTEPLAY